MHLSGNNKNHIKKNMIKEANVSQPALTDQTSKTC